LDVPFFIEVVIVTYLKPVSLSALRSELSKRHDNTTGVGYHDAYRHVLKW